MVRSMARHLYGSTSPNDVWFSFMREFNTYSDAAGKEGNGPDYHVAMAGFAATVASWEHFSRSWNELLDRYEIPYLQMSLLHSRKDFFGKPRWKSSDYMESFLGKANQIIRSHVTVGAIAGVRIRDFKLASDRLKLDRRLNAYALCGASVLLKLQKLIEKKSPEPVRVAHFVESGDQGKGMIDSILSTAGYNPSIARPGKPQKGQPNRDHYVAFQASDYLAFEARKLMNGYAVTEEMRMRRNLEGLLDGVQVYAVRYSAQQVEDFCSRRSIGEVPR